MKANQLKVIAALIAATSSLAAQAKLVEDGCSFTGLYQTQEHISECFYQPENPYSPNAPRDQVTIQGTPEGLVVNGTLIQIQDTSAAGLNPNLNQVLTKYISGSEFYSKETLKDITPNEIFQYDYLLDDQGNIVLTEINSSGDTSTNTVCHLNRIQEK